MIILKNNVYFLAMEKLFFISNLLGDFILFGVLERGLYRCTEDLLELLLLLELEELLDVELDNDLRLFDCLKMNGNKILNEC